MDHLWACRKWIRFESGSSLWLAFKSLFGSGWYVNKLYLIFMPVKQRQITYDENLNVTVSDMDPHDAELEEESFNSE